ncbi:hypothetical protein LTR10_017673 [Elasticomyces elasticus]|uniref:PNPLA domain-containing protein n=1 Tax=Exophiala sideris TaxID=1016849 RepID=A0ABR0JBL0_9EURO|nr:hypothetical protein LTR10_017673 [Elasticomyces elasticus]KAK5031078.1 hypothetical protein LTS07_004813 [Exophiala sideris]KAK5038800.1 hypothetical protein LTR13_003831 [Exophiala sideris]KAK5060683.1 hypothetical protein LTR69_005282 [Exophiala sideris]KAK5183596.1 hypothetical protein LTR44_003878 [Eurotiomycetes sp. CCFEE 6388]
MDNQQPLKILTLDGGGLQALATLSSICAVCQAIAKENKAARIPAPHELFDIICGVGTGGWIALLLGRYRLDIATCMAVYMEIARKVDSDRTTSRWPRRNRAFKLDQERLVSVVEDTLLRYGLDASLLREDSPLTNTFERGQTRCAQAFAVGVKQGRNIRDPEYELFRSYTFKDKTTATLPGPEPKKCRTSQAFAAVGAAKFFLKPYKVGKSVFFDETFPQSHPISSVALDEALALHGPNVEISVLLNIGPGIPSEQDCRTLDSMSIGPISRLARKFSWPGRKEASLKEKLSKNKNSQNEVHHHDSTPSTPSESALRLECQRRLDIRDRLKALYGDSGSDKYHHLGPDYSLEKASLNDVHAIRLFRTRSRESQSSAAEIGGAVSQYWVNTRA